MKYKIAILPGDGIGPEIIDEAVKVLQCLQADFGFAAELEESPVGGAGYDARGNPLPDETLALARDADAILLGSVGGPQWEALERCPQGRALRTDMPRYRNVSSRTASAPSRFTAS